MIVIFVVPSAGAVVAEAVTMDVFADGRALASEVVHMAPVKAEPIAAKAVRGFSPSFRTSPSHESTIRVAGERAAKNG